MAPSNSNSPRDLGSLASSTSSIFTSTNASTGELARRRGLDPSGILAHESRLTTAVAETSLVISDAGSSLTFDHRDDNSAANGLDQNRSVLDTNAPARASSTPPAATTTTPGGGLVQEKSKPRRSMMSFVHRSSRRAQQHQDYALLRALASSDNNNNYNKTENRTNGDEGNQHALETQAVVSGSEGTLQTRATIREPQGPSPLPNTRPKVTMYAEQEAPPPPKPRVNAEQAQVLRKEIGGGDDDKQQKQTPPSPKENRKMTVKPAPQPPPKEDPNVKPEEKGQPQQENTPPNPTVFPANATASGKALEFAQKVIQMHQRWTESTQGRAMSILLKLCHADDIVVFAEQMLLHREQQQQQQRQSRQAQTVVEMAYAFAPAAKHPASQQGERVHRAGLYTTASRDAVFGQGIYTSKSVYSGQRLHWKSMPRIFLVARFLGKVVHVGTSSVSNSILRGGTDVDTVVGMVGTEEVAVLRQSSQCLPLLKIEPEFLSVSHAQGNIVLSQYQNQLNKTLDELFNGGGAAARAIVPKEATPPPQRPPPAVTPREATPPPPPSAAAAVPAPAPVPTVAEPTPEVSAKEHPKMMTVLLYAAPTSQRQRETGHLSAPLVIDANVDLNTMKPLHPRHGATRCARCGVPPSSTVRIIPSKPPETDSRAMPTFSMAYSCGSTFDVGIDHSLREFATWPSLLDDPALLQRIQSRVVEHSRKCTAGCRRHRDTHCDFTTPVGTMPSGSMRIDELPDLTCPGFADETNGSGDGGSFLITYRISGGLQCNYHPTPGQAFPPVYREAFLPANSEGRALLKRLQYAFVRGLTFRVGRSVTTGRPGTITWGSIPHKTTLFHHLYGYPDPDFFVNANNELDALGVPVASDL